MDEIWRHFGWILGTGGFGAMVGGVFGGVTGAIHWGSGRQAGTFLAHRVAAAFERAGEEEMSPRVRGTLVGATDGFLFLGIAGTLLGIVFAYVGRPDDDILIEGAVGFVLVAVTTVGFGVLAYAIVRNGVWAVVGLFIGGLGGAFTAALMLGTDHLLLGVVPGMVAGTTASFLVRKYAPHYRPPGVAQEIHDEWRRTGDAIQSKPPESGSQAIQKAEPSEDED